MLTATLRHTLLLALGLTACGEPTDEEETETKGETLGPTTTVGTSAGSATSTSGGVTTEGVTSGGVTTEGVTTEGVSSTGGSSAGDSSTTEISGASETSSTGQPVCEPVLERHSGMPSGFETCEGGIVVRREPESCSPIDPATVEIDPSCLESDYGQCESHEDCSDAPLGLCEGVNAGESSCHCRYGCESDADCSDGSICLCGIEIEHVPPQARCVEATCDSDAECEDGYSCALAVGNDGCGWRQMMACRTSQDTCTTNADCEDTSGGCYPGETGAWECNLPNCVIGRPFIVEGEVTVASWMPRPDWSAVDMPIDGGAASTLDTLTAGERRILRDYWLRNAALEHASVASFARFVLQLMHLGAPPKLLREATHAMNDEIIHAERCFALASRYGQAPVGPDRLPLCPGTLGQTSWIDILEAVVVEACIGETLAALEAAMALEHASDPEVRATLAIIARDEARHAALGWETLRWALDTGEPAMRDELKTLVHKAIAEARLLSEASAPGHQSSALAAHGKLSPAQRSRAIQDGLDEVVLPLAQALWTGRPGAEQFASAC